MSDKQRGFHHLHKVDKGIAPVEHFHPAHNDIPTAGICGAPMNADPHAAGPRMPVHIQPDARRPRGEPAEMKPPHNPAPHPYNPSSSVKLRNTYGTVRR